MGTEIAVSLICLVLLLYYYQHYYKYGYSNTSPVSPCSTCETYNVHREHDDQAQAAKLLKEVTVRNAKLLEHLEQKYSGTELMNGLEPTKNNRIDVIPGSNIYYSIDPNDVDVASTMRHVSEKENIQERIAQLLRNYNPRDIFEISPMNSEGVTSYSEDKKKLILCLRKKETDMQGRHELHDINTVMFVVLHELSHMMNAEWDHPLGFWLLFKFMLLNAVEIGIYQPVDYSVHPILYCGLLLTYNPIFDKRM
jgi:hypothetical protein